MLLSLADAAVICPRLSKGEGAAEAQTKNTHLPCQPHKPLLGELNLGQQWAGWANALQRVAMSIKTTILDKMTLLLFFTTHED